MKVNGYKLREALRRWQLRRDTAAGQFPKVLTAFPDDHKPSPVDIAAAVVTAETNIAALQTAQTAYNQRITVEAQGHTFSLLGAIKSVGGLGRVEKMWRTASAPPKDRYMSNDETRPADQVVAKRQITYEQAAAYASDIGKQLGALREAIATGNARELEVDLDPALFE